MEKQINRDDPVIIVGAGLSGLRAASLLSAQGIKFIVLEARDRIGGRVLSVEVEDKPELGKFDLGPTWYWPRYEMAMNRLVDEFGLQTFEQFNEGSMLFERSRNEPPQKHDLSTESMEYSLRLVGGVQSLVDALASKLPQEALHLNTKVTSIQQDNNRVKVQTDGRSIYASSVIIALPPRIVEQDITFIPQIPSDLKSNFIDKPTWMAGHAKVIAVYDSPFWRNQGLSGFVSSRVGPLQEIHDASPSTGSGALFGFFGIPAEVRISVGKEQLLELVLEQLTRLFGPLAKEVRAILYKDWSLDTHTSVKKDGEPLREYPNYGPLLGGKPWLQNIYFAGTETAYGHGGHLEGALQSAESVVNEVIRRYH
ncbi:FAD-dependent oxidoreductase [Paenibacillus sp. LK1]|uniref:flavin monoamine oxidase family protein n=1 Tax=Paenibacillus sp. LK1 TaxID=2053014 RepID=UPI000C1803E0|nr:FAD-dependent oxidoreductase [Paenibacillus sp. LK1]PIH60269.1 amine oxidase [Paenibacillus sp. LK1]